MRLQPPVYTEKARAPIQVGLLIMPRKRHGVSLVNLLMRMRSLGHGSHYTRKTWLKYPGTHWRVLETKRKDRVS